MKKPANLVAEYPTGGMLIDSLAFSSQGYIFVGLYGRIETFDLRKSRVINDVSVPTIVGKFHAFRVTADGKKLLAGTHSGRIRVFDIHEDGSLELSGAFDEHKGPVKMIVVSDDSKLVVSYESSQWISYLGLRHAERKRCIA